MSKEFSFIMQVQQLEELFLHRWGKYCQAIIDFANATKHKTKELKHALRDDDSSAEGVCKICFCCILYFMVYI